MTEEEKELFIRKLHNKFGYYEVRDLTREENNIHGRYYMAYGTEEDVQREIDRINQEIRELEGITDYKEYYKTLVKDHINLDAEDNFFKDADPGFEDLGDLYQKFEENQKKSEENAEKQKRFNDLKAAEEEKSERLASNAEAKTADYEAKTKDFVTQKEESIKEAAENEKRRIEGVKKMEDQISKEISRLKSENPDAARMDELNEKLSELNARKDPYEREINGKSTGDQEYNDILRSIDDIKTELSSINERNAKNISSITRLEQMLKSYQDEEARAHQEYLESVENAESRCNEELSKFETEKKEANVAQNELKECQNKIASYGNQAKEAEDALNVLNQEKEELDNRLPAISKACKEKIIAEDKEKIPLLESYKKVVIKLHFEGYKENPDPDKVINGLSVVKEAYDSYYQSHNWFTRMFKNWPNTSAGKDYAKYMQIRNEFTRISRIPKEEIDEYLDHEKYTGTLGQKKTAFDEIAARENEINNDGNARIPYEVDNKELNGEAMEAAPNLGGEAPQMDGAEEQVQNGK